jgi:hypothetical protein
LIELVKNGMVSYSLHRDDRELLLKMIIEMYSNKECSSKIINIEDSKSCIDYLVFLLVMIQQQQQKIMDILLNYKDVNKEKKITLLDFCFYRT